MKNRLAIITICYISVFTSFAQKDLLQSGPMLGYTDMRETAIWVQTKREATVLVKYWLPDNPDSVLITNSSTTLKENAFTTIITVDQVEPGFKYQYQLYINNIAINLPYKCLFQTQHIWKWRNDPPDFSFATGSCAYINEEKYDRPGTPYGSNYQIFESIHADNPDCMIWLGDNMYLREPDWHTWTGITERWTHTRSIKEMQPLLASTHHYAIWDDHDYGPDNSDRGWWNKNQTLKAFELFWANPSYGIGEIKGAITQFQWNDVDFFLLDNRYYRTPNNLRSTNKTILGHAQKQWLKDALVSSQATYKVIATGGQFLNDAGKFEMHSSNGFNTERLEIINFIYDQDIKNVVFVTGDRHHTELSILKEEGKPRIIDITVSAFTSGPGYAKDEKNTLRVPGTYTNLHNYGIIGFSGTEKQRKMTIAINDADGNLIWEKVFLKE